MMKAWAKVLVVVASLAAVAAALGQDVVSSLTREDITSGTGVAGTVGKDDLKGMSSPRVELPGGMPVELAYIPAGRLTMGSPPEDPNSGENERPVHSVTIPQSFYIGKYELTVGQYKAFQHDYGILPWFSTNGARHALDGDLQPAFVSWQDATAFCKWLSGKTGQIVRLPTEAEWEYACRAGTTTRFFWGDDEAGALAFANVADRSFEKENPRSNCFSTDDGYVVSSPVGTFMPNAFGLYDMIGNASEWCLDKYDADAYRKSGGHIGREPNRLRVVRGGGWQSPVGAARSAARRGVDEAAALQYVGFRVVVELSDNLPLPQFRPVPAAGEEMRTHTNLAGWWMSGVIVLMLSLVGIWFYGRRRHRGTGTKSRAGR